MTPRQAAVLSLNNAIKNGRFINLELDAAIKKYGFEDKDRTFFTRLLYGTVERKITLDFLIGELSERSLDRIQPLVLCILELGLYQVFYMDKVPDSAACNESTELVKTLCPSSYAGFVNAIMRNAVRQKTKLEDTVRTLTGMKGLSVQTGIPAWICQSFETDYGNAKDIATGFSLIPPHVTLHVNTLKISAQDFFEKLPEDFHARKISDSLVTIGKSVPIDSVYGFEEGLFFVQDEASAVSAALIRKSDVPNEHPLVVDTCACPGGKTFAIAMELANKGTVYAFDLHKNRLSLIESGTKRLGITSVQTEAHDARKPVEALFGKADAVLCDVPCSGLGILAKKPDIRYKMPEEIARLAPIQREILEKSAAYVKSGGVLVYSTCTLRKEENEHNVLDFLQAHPEFEPVDTAFADTSNGMKTFFPHIDGTDGFFAAKLRKK